MKKIVTCLVLVIFATFFVANAQTSKEIKLKPNENKFQVVSKSSQGLTIFNSLAELKVLDVVTKSGKFAMLENENLMKTFESGLPNIPVISKLIEVPQDANVEINIISYNEEIIKLSDYGITNKVIPAQLSLSKSDDPNKIKFQYNKVAYQLNDYVNKTIAIYENSGMMRGTRFGRIEIRPIQYNPVQNTLRILNNLVVEVKFVGGNDFKTTLLKEKYYSPYFEGTLAQTINHESSNSKGLITAEPVKYVIVSDIMFQATLQPFIAWKKLKGFNVIEAYTNNPAVGNTTTSIKAYLQGLYNNGTPTDPAPSFVLFVGDIAQVPAWAGTAGSHITDLYYCEYTGDKVPEVFYGRFSATSIAQLQPQIDKTLEYEKYLMPDPSYLNNVLMIAGADASHQLTWGNGQINYGTSTYFNASNGLTSHTYLQPYSGGSGPILADVNNGISFGNYTAHGSPTGWADPSFSTSNIASLTNNHKFGLLVGNCCLTNKFDETECFGEALLRTANKGALGYIGGTNSTFWDEDYWWGVGFKEVVTNPTYDAAKLGGYDVTFHTHAEPTSAWYLTQGQMVVGGNMANEQSTSTIKTYYWEVYTLMGDPSLTIYYGVPTVQSVSPVPSTLMIGMTSLTVTTTPYAYVALSFNGALLSAKMANNLGVANLTFPALTNVGTANLVVTAQNKQPYIGTITVSPSNQPYIVLNSNATTVAPDFGATVGFNTTLENVSNNPYNASNVIATLSTVNTFVTINDNTQNYGTINAGTTKLINNAFGITIANNVADQTNIPFNLHITGTYNTKTDYTWDSPLNLIVNAPVMSIGNIIISDPLPGGNNNGRMDPDETVTITIPSSNTGHANSTSAVGTLTCVSPYITINGGGVNTIGAINAGTTANPTFTVVVGASTPIGTAVNFEYTLVAGQYQDAKTIPCTIGLIFEDWETNTFNKFDWYFSGAANWTLVGSGAQYEGNYCAKSGTITINQVSNLDIKYQVDANDSIKFYKKVSSESEFDSLSFWIDANKKSTWAGTTDVWSLVKFPVSAGTHTFRWGYSKDGSVTSGSDCAWIDYIVFPGGWSIPNAINKVELTNKVDFNCYPNPFNQSTTLTYTLDKSSNVSLIVYNSYGKEVNVLVNNSKQSEGLHNVVLSGSKLSAGIYYCVLKTDGNVITKKISITR